MSLISLCMQDSKTAEPVPVVWATQNGGTTPPSSLDNDDEEEDNEVLIIS